MKIGIINGPNLNLLGKRQPEIYGKTSFASYLVRLKESYSSHELSYFQSNSEGAIIDKLHDWGFTMDGIILNPAAYTHTSIAIADAVSSIDSPVVEVHISDLEQRESFRQVSYLRVYCKHHIMGEGLRSYDKAIDFLIKGQIQ